MDKDILHNIIEDFMGDDRFYTGYHKGQWDYSLNEKDVDDLVEYICENYKNELREKQINILTN